MHYQIVNFISVIGNSFLGADYVFKNGSCYQFYTILKERFPTAVAYYNSDHVITRIGNRYYDITGEVERTNHLEMAIHYPESEVRECKFNVYELMEGILS